MIVFSFLMESVLGRKENLDYKPKHPFLYYGPIIGSGIAGGLIGYNVGEDYFNMKHPSIGGLIGSLNGLNAGVLAGEYLDRKQREKDGKPYTGQRTMNDSGKEFLIRTGIGNAVAVPIAATGSSLFGPAVLSARVGYNLAPIINDRLSHPEVYEKMRKK